MYRDVATDIADGMIHQKDISYEGLEKMQKSNRTHRDIGVIERLYLKSPLKAFHFVPLVTLFFLFFFHFFKF